ncbi:MAG: GAF domain-containing protein, partial [Anaerolineae bacterium]
MTRAKIGMGAAGETLLESMRTVQQALMRPSGLPPEQLIARIQEWQQVVTDLTKEQMHSVELATLYEITGVINSSLDLTETLGLVMDALIHLTGAERGCLMLLGEEGSMEVRAAQNFDRESTDAFDLELSRTVVRDAVEKGQPVLTTNAQLDPRFSEQESVIGYHLRSIACVPLCIQNNVIGALYLDNRKRDAVFSQADLHILTAFANQAAVAIENARLYTMTGQALAAQQELTTLYRASRSIGEATDFQEIARGAAVIAPLLDMTACSLTVITATDEQGIPVRGDVYAVSTTEDGFASLAPISDCPIVDQQALDYAVTGRDSIIVHADAQDPEDSISPQVREAILNAGMRSTVTAGLSVQGWPVGFLTFSHTEPLTDFPESHKRRIRTVADQIVPVLENLRLLKETRRRAQELKVVADIGQAITSVLDLDTVLRQIADTIKVRFGNYFVGIALVQKDQLISQSGSTVGDSNFRFERGQLSVALAHEASLIAEAARTGQPVLSNDTLDDPRYLAVKELPDTRCELCLPIRVKGRVIGVLDVQSDRPFAYSPTNVALLQSLADRAGAAIENARLFEQVQAYTIELATLNSLGQALTAHLNVEEVLDEAYRQTSRLLDTTNFYIGLYDQENHEIHFAIDVSESAQDEDIPVISADQGIGGYIVRN